MATLEESLKRLTSFNDQLLQKDGDLDETVGAKRREESAGGSVEQQFDEESIVLRRTRPVLAIRDDAPQLVFVDGDDIAIWKQRLTDASAKLLPAIRAVGRIEVQGHPDYEWVGTGWLIDDGLMVTNRHVAELFANGMTLVFKPGQSGPITARIDFVREFDNDATRPFKVLRPLYIEPLPGPDMALFQVEAASGQERLARPIPLAAGVPTAEPYVAVIGYPARDDVRRVPDIELMERIYGNRYDRKRLAPGSVTAVDATRLYHNCTTLGGNSGSVVLNLKTGEALGLHYSGRFLDTNFAVRADIVRDRLDAFRRGTPDARPAPRMNASTSGAQLQKPGPRAPEGPTARAPRVAPGANGEADGSADTSFTFTVPLRITVSVGTPTREPAPPARPARAPTAARPAPASGSESEDLTAQEAAPASYAGREGYDPSFLGPNMTVALPSVARGSEDVLTFDVDGKTQSELRYEHFSVVMSASRRMCFFSAANIDGGQSRKTKRANWRTDPRIPKDAQILNECYGSPPKFSRGHMTRREDPAWGTQASVDLGNQDSMHVTNTVPQMQSFNAPIWLQLEDYALQNARGAEMKISVFTGPYFDRDGVADPVMYGVKIPRAFWKIIAFVHDVTGELSATGYEMSQEGNLPEEEFVFGDLTSSYLNVSTQVPIRKIEERTGLRFANLAAVDPLGAVNEAVGDAEPQPLLSLSQIRFR